MQLHLNQAEVETALRDFIQNMGVEQPVGAVTFVDTDGGFAVEIEIGNSVSENTGSTNSSPRRRRRTKAEIAADEAAAEGNGPAPTGVAPPSDEEDEANDTADATEDVAQAVAAAPVPAPEVDGGKSLFG